MPAANTGGSRTETNRASQEMEQKIRDSVRSLVEFAIKNYGDEKLAALGEFSEVVGWYNDAAEGKLDRSEALATVSNHIIENLIEKIVGYLQQILIGGLEVKAANSKEKMIKKIDLQAAFEYEMTFVKELEGKEVASCKITFNIAGAGKLEGVKIHRISDRTEIDISNFSLPISISITKIRLELLGMPPLPKETLLTRPIPIIEGYPLQFENYSFSFG
jgi:hypothetical protein